MISSNACVRRVVSLRRRYLQLSPSGGRPSVHREHGNQYSFRHFASNGGKDEDDEEWIPPDHSPLLTNKISLEERTSIFNKQPNPHNAEEVIEVIDLEATLNDKSNQQILKDEQLEMAETPSSEFDIQSSTINDWKDILRELKADGETEMLDRLVQEYNLQSHLAALNDDEQTNLKVGQSNIAKDRGMGDSIDRDEEEEWDEEFEQTLQGLSQEELIDELIENSPSLSQLEMEILSQELERSEQGEQGGLDYDSLEDMDWKDNTSYRDFRAMVLEDYHEKKASGKTVKQFSAMSDGDITDTATNASVKSEFAAYPPDWKDYDSRAAFQRDFSEDGDSWVPPSSEFIQSRTYDEDRGGSRENNPPQEDSATNELDNTIDWLQARRSRLGEDLDGQQSNQTPTHMLTPEEAETFRHQNSQIPIVPYTLLTTSELSTSLTAQGGTDIHIIDASEFGSMQGVGMGCNFILLVTGRNFSHIRVLADSIVRNLKARKLHERGVVGAMQGAEGGQDIFSNKRSRNRASRNGINASGKVDDDWMVVDCDNIHVHILEETTRKCLNIEGLWDLSNPNSEGRKLRRVDLNDDDAVDDYVAENPIPDEYAAKIFNQGGGRIGDWVSGGVNGRVQAAMSFQRNSSQSFSEKWGGISKTKRKNKRRGK